MRSLLRRPRAIFDALLLIYGVRRGGPSSVVAPARDDATGLRVGICLGALGLTAAY
jgi:hypothetical protein